MGQITITLSELCDRWPGLTWRELSKLINSLDIEDDAGMPLFLMGTGPLNGDMQAKKAIKTLGFDRHTTFLNKVKEIENQYPELNNTDKEDMTEDEKVKDLMKRHDLKLGEAKEIRIAYLKDVELLEYMEIGKRLGFDYVDKTQASNNLKSRVIKGRKLRERHGE